MPQSIDIPEKNYEMARWAVARRTDHLEDSNCYPISKYRRAGEWYKNARVPTTYDNWDEVESVDANNHYS